MELPKSLINAIVVGITLSATSACTLLDNTQDITPSGEENTKPKVEKPRTNTSCPGDNNTYYDCPACGMG